MKIKANLLLAENDYNFATTLRKGLADNGFIVDHFRDGELAWKAFTKTRYDICVVDTALPKKNGYTLTSSIRKLNEKIPIIFISEKDEDEDRLQGYRMGGDAFLNKVFALEELILRMEALLKRSIVPPAGTLYIGNCLFSPSTSTIKLSRGRTVQLTQRECQLLSFLALNANKIIKRDELLYSVWGKVDHFLGRSMDVFMTQLRQLFAAEKGIEIVTLHGIGFKFEAPVELAAERVTFTPR